MKLSPDEYLVAYAHVCDERRCRTFSPQEVLADSWLHDWRFQREKNSKAEGKVGRYLRRELWLQQARHNSRHYFGHSLAYQIRHGQIILVGASLGAFYF